MELLQLRYFYESACNESITKTAVCHMVPPSSVSVAIKRLETEMGCTLFDRSGNRIRLNEKGTILKNALETVFGELDDAVTRITNQNPCESRDIYLLVRSERQILLDCIALFRRLHPKAVFHLSHEFISEKIHQFDMIIDDATVEYEGFRGTPVIREHIRIAASQDNPLCGQRMTMGQLQTQSFITMYRGSSMQRITQECCRRAGFQPNIIIESDDPQYLRKYIELDFGVAFVPETSWRGQMGKTQYLDVTDLDEQRITAVYRNTTKKLNSMAESFFDMLIQHCRMVESTV